MKTAAEFDQAAQQKKERKHKHRRERESTVPSLTSVFRVHMLLASVTSVLSDGRNAHSTCLN